MSRSSGVYVTSVIEHHQCAGQIARTRFASGGTWTRPCTFEGDVDVLIDPEAQAAAWECPGCGVLHELDWDVLHEGEIDE